MPAVKVPSISLAHKSFPPYDMNHYPRGPFVRIHMPSFDVPFTSHDFVAYDSFDESQISLSQWMNTGPMYHDPELYESAQCPPSHNHQPQFDANVTYEEPIDNNLFSWPYENVGYDASFSSLPESSTFSNTFSPSVSMASCSPRSESSAALSLSPQPNLTDYSNTFNFNYNTSMPQQFPAASSSTWQAQTLPMIPTPSRSSMSHSPSASCSSLDGAEVKHSPSRDASPMRAATDVDPQASRRRFPCIIIGCDRRFTSQYTLKVHMEAHKPKPRSSFPCTLGCSERFSRQHDRLRHEVAKHGKVCEFLCDDCGRFFSTKKTLGNHKCPVAQGGTRWVNQ